MSATEVDIVNAALSGIGLPQIASLSDNSRRAKEANLIYDTKRDELQTDHNWNFATKRIILSIPTASKKAITGITQANPVVVTAVAHGFANAQSVFLESIVGTLQLNGGRFEIQNVAANTFELKDIDGLLHTAYVSGGTARIVPAFGPANEFDLPSDFERMDRTDEASDDWRIENGKIVSDLLEVNMVYIANITVVTEMSNEFKRVLSARLGADLAIPLTGSQSRADKAEAKFDKAFAKALFTDSQQRSRTQLGSSTWLDGRIQEPAAGRRSGWANA